MKNPRTVAFTEACRRSCVKAQNGTPLRPASLLAPHWHCDFQIHSRLYEATPHTLHQRLYHQRVNVGRSSGKTLPERVWHTTSQHFYGSKMDDDDSQGRRTKNSTPLGFRDTPRKSLRRVASQSTPSTPTPKVEDEDKVSGDITVKLEPGQAPKLARSSSKKIPSRPAPKFLDWQDAGPEARRGFEGLDKCSYANKFLGITDPALECDCVEEWGK